MTATAVLLCTRYGVHLGVEFWSTTWLRTLPSLRAGLMHVLGVDREAQHLNPTVIELLSRRPRFGSSPSAEFSQGVLGRVQVIIL